MPLPNFIIFGAIKSGTGALFQYLNHHPQIYMSLEKEPRFFSNNSKNHKESIDEYMQFFSGVKNEKAIGEASSNYINSAAAPIRIKETIPNVKLIASLRNPVDRAYAHYRMAVKKTKNINFANMRSGKAQGWAITSLYYEQLRGYYKLFEKNQIKILIFEHWTVDVSNTLKEIYSFLGIDETYSINSGIHYAPGEVTWPGVHRNSLLKRVKPYLPEVLLLHINKTKRKLSPRWPPLPDELKKDMQKWYSDDILKLQSLINKDLSIWLK